MDVVASTLVKHLTNLNKMKQKLEIFKSDALSLKAELVEYIHDRTIPLDDRWGAWLEAPDLLKELDPCVVDSIDYVWQPADSAIAEPTPYGICMAEHYKYLQYDTVDMDDFERGCIVGRRLQSEKLARMLK